MITQVGLKSGMVFYVEAHEEDVRASWIAALGDGSKIISYPQEMSGIPRPTITIDMREIAYIKEYR